MLTSVSGFFLSEKKSDAAGEKPKENQKKKGNNARNNFERTTKNTNVPTSCDLISEKKLSYVKKKKKR
jgi:hypothetical protein